MVSPKRSRGRLGRRHGNSATGPLGSAPARFVVQLTLQEHRASFAASRTQRAGAAMGDAIDTSELDERGARTVAIVSNDLGYVTSFRGPVIERLRQRGCSVTVIAPASSDRAADR